MQIFINFHFQNERNFCPGQNFTSSNVIMWVQKAQQQLQKDCGLIKDPFITQNIKRLVDKFESTGSVLDQMKSGRPSLQDGRSVAVEDNNLQNTVTKFGCSSFRRMSEETSIPQSSVRLKPTDAPLRLHFTKWLLDNQDKSDNILWSNECSFLHERRYQHEELLFGLRKTQEPTVPCHCIHKRWQCG